MTEVEIEVPALDLLGRLYALVGRPIPVRRADRVLLRRHVGHGRFRDRFP